MLTNPRDAMLYIRFSRQSGFVTYFAMKKRSERRKHCALAVVKRSQTFGDGHYLHLQTQFGENRCTQFRVIMVTDPHTHKQTNKNKQNRLQ